MQSFSAQFYVGLFILAALLAMLLLAFKVSGLAHVGPENNYELTAEFDNIGGLKVRAPVLISGVKVGQIKNIILDKNNFRALVTLQMNNQLKTLPIDTQASILTQGILGSNYVGLTPGFEEKNLTNGDRIETTHSALILESLVGDLIYSLKQNGKTENVSQNQNQNNNNQT